MSNQGNTAALRYALEKIVSERNELADLRKLAFMPAPAMPQGPPPMDPAMMQQGGAPPMDPSMMQQGAPPMDPSMAQGGMPPQGGPPMDPSMMQQGAPPSDPNAAPPESPISPEMMDQVLGMLEEIGQKMQALSDDSGKFRQQVEQAINDLGEQVTELDQRFAQMASVTAPAAMPAQ